MTTTVIDPPEFAWDDAGLPPAEVEGPVDKTEWINPPKNACPVCGEEVVKEPHQKRRLKYHPECKPTGRKADGSPRPVRVVSKDREAAEQVEMILDRVRKALAKAVMLTALADPFDALVIHVNSEEIVENLRPLLMRFPFLREQGANASALGAILGLVITALTTLLPILAHHGMFPIKKIVPLLLDLPVIMLNMQEMAMQNGEDTTQTLLMRVAQEKRRAQEAAMRAASVETVNAS